MNQENFMNNNPLPIRTSREGRSDIIEVGGGDTIDPREIKTRDAETFSDKNVVLQRLDREASQERLSVCEKTPAIFNAAKVLSSAFHQVRDPEGKPILWGFFGSFAYQVDAQSGVVEPDDIDGFYDVAFQSEVYTKLLALKKEGVITQLDDPYPVESTGAVVLRGLITYQGEDVEFEMFGQTMGDPKKQEGFVNVGVGEREYTINQYAFGDDAEYCMNIIDAAGQVELYARRLLVEFPQGIEDLRANDYKHKVAFRLFRIMRLMDQYESDKLKNILQYVAKGERLKHNINELRTLRDLEYLYEQFNKEIEFGGDVSLGGESFDVLERELMEFGEESIDDAVTMRGWYVQLQVIKNSRAPIKNEVPSIYGILTGTQEFIKKYEAKLQEVSDDRMFGMYAQLHQILYNFALPLVEEIESILEMNDEAIDI